MKPNFALNFTDEGVTLLHRTARGWLDVGYVAFDDADLAAALDYLRSTALGLSAKGVTTKLLIPNSQILYLDVSAPGPDKAKKEAQIAAALEGRTPYDVSELAYDWIGKGSAVRVAVVAKETLAEAEAFATEHRFNPVSFAAIPPDGFSQEPFFGPSQLATSLVPKGQKLERDLDPTVIVTREMPKADIAEDTAQEAETEIEAETAVEATGEADSLSGLDDTPTAEMTKAEMPTALTADQAAAPSMEPEPPLPSPVEAGPAINAPEPAATVEAPLAAPPSPADLLPADLSDESKAGLSTVDPAIAPPSQTPPIAPPMAKTEVSATPDGKTAPPTQATEPDEAPMAVDVPIEDLPEVPKPSVLKADLDDIPPAPATATLMAFASRRAAEMDGKKATETPSRVVPMPPLGNANVTAPSVPRPASAKPILERPAAVSRPSPKFSYDDPVPPPPRLPGDPPAASVGVMSKAGKGLRSLGTLVSAPGLPGGRKKPVPAQQPAPSAPVSPAVSAATLKATSTKPVAVATSAKVTRLADVERPAKLSNGAAVAPDALARGLGARAVPQRGKPRFLGLIMTGILLLLLAIVAAWSSFFLAQNTPSVGDEEIIASTAGGPQNVVADVPAPDDEILADLADQGDVEPEVAPQDAAAIDAPSPIDPQLAPAPAAPLAELAPVTEPVAEPVASPEPDTSPEPVTTVQAPEPQPEQPEPAPQTRVETQAASAAVQPGIEGQDEIFLSAMDAPPSFSDPLVMTRPVGIDDVLPGPQMPPPPFGTVYQFDENGLIQPTPEGITTPEGVRLVAGKPPVLPPQRPAAIEAAAAPAPAPAEVSASTAAATDLTPAQTFAADPALQNARPRLRPEGLAPATATSPAGGEDDASLAPAEGSRFASLRPRARPQIILAAGETARRESEAASIALQAAAAAAAQAVVEEQAQSAANSSPLAVTVSRLPAPRPRDLAKAVEVAVAAATRQSEPRAAITPTEPEQDEEADSEPEVVASAAPRIPTRANVAKQATFVNAINLSKTNLIGVYGTQSKRYALIRQSNGRYKKVRIGDSVDGGKVQAITATEVRYQKGGRLLTLAMPKT